MNYREPTHRYSKTLECLAERDQRIDEYWYDEDGHWMHLKDEWVTDDGCISLHEYTVANMRKAVSTQIKKRGGS